MIGLQLFTLAREERLEVQRRCACSLCLLTVNILQFLPWLNEYYSVSEICPALNVYLLFKVSDTKFNTVDTLFGYR